MIIVMIGLGIISPDLPLAGPSLLDWPAAAAVLALAARESRMPGAMTETIPASRATTPASPDESLKSWTALLNR